MTTPSTTTNACMKLVFKDYWRITFSLENVPISDGPVEVSLTAISPNGYRDPQPVAATLVDGATQFEVVYPLLDDGEWRGPVKGGGTEEYTRGWDRRWTMGHYVFAARLDRPGLSPVTVATRLDVYDLYKVPKGEHTATHSSRQFLECSPLRPIYIDEDRAGFHVRTVSDRVSECEIEADVVLAKTNESQAGPWRLTVDHRRRRRSFSTKGWPRADYWIRLRAVHQGEPVGPFCVRLFTKEGSGVAARSTPADAPLDLGSGTVFLTDRTFFENDDGVRFCPDPVPTVPDRPVIEPDRPWELTNLHTRDMSYDSENRQFRLIYRTYSHGPQQPGSADTMKNVDLLAVSSDGLQWEKPELGLVEFNGSTANNILSNKPRSLINGKFDKTSDEARRALQSAKFHFYDADRDGSFDLDELFIPHWKRGFPADCKSIVEANAIPEPSDGDDIVRGVTGATAMIERDGDYYLLTREPVVYAGMGQDLRHATETVRGHANLDRSKGLFYFYRPTPPGYPPHWAPSDNLCRGRRCIAVLWTTDGLTWNRRFALSPDEFDVDGTVYYAMNVIGPIGSDLVLPHTFKRDLYAQSALAPGPMVLGTVLHYELWSGRMWPELVWSRDLVHWERFNKERRPFIELGEPGSYRGGWIRGQEGQAFQFGDEWWFSYSASSSLHYMSKAAAFQGDLDRFKKRFPNYRKMGGFQSWEQAFQQRANYHAAPAIARCKVGRVAHAEPANGKGRLISKVLQAAGDRLVINAAVAPGGSVAVAVTDAANHDLPGYGLADCVTFTGDDTAHSMAWRSSARQSLEGRPIRLHFELDRANLYTFRFAASGD